MRRYPLEPFFALTRWTLSDVQDVAGCNADEWRKRKTEGVTEQIADRIACAAGLVPQVVWPDFGLLPCDECGTPFARTHPRRRFCSRTCVSRRWQRSKYRSDAEFREAEKAARRQRYAECAEYEKARQRRYRSKKPQVRRAKVGTETSGPGLAGNENRDLADTPGLEVADRAGR